MKCWQCGDKTMSPYEDLGKGWFKCSVCGATDVEMPKVGRERLLTERNPQTGGMKYKAVIMRVKKAKVL